MVQDGAVNSELHLNVPSEQELYYLSNHTGNQEETAGAFDNAIDSPQSLVIDSHIVLYNNTNIVYKLPRNTSLIEVLGPVGQHSAWLGDSRCYAQTEPPGKAVQLSTSKKVANDTDQIMFLLPVEPWLEHTLHVGGLGHWTSCPVSAIRAYPYN